MEASRRASVPSNHIRPCTASGGTTRNLAHSPPLHSPHLSRLALPQNSSHPNCSPFNPHQKAGEQFPLHPSLTSLPCISPLVLFSTSSHANPSSPTPLSKQESSISSLPPIPPTFPQHLLRSVSRPEGEVKLHSGGSFREAEGQQVLVGDDMPTGKLSDCRLRYSEREEQLLLEFRHLG